MTTQIVISAAEHVAVMRNHLRTADVWMFGARVTGLIPISKISTLLPRRFGQTFKMSIVRWCLMQLLRRCGSEFAAEPWSLVSPWVVANAGA